MIKLISRPDSIKLIGYPKPLEEVTPFSKGRYYLRSQFEGELKKTLQKSILTVDPHSLISYDEAVQEFKEHRVRRVSAILKGVMYRYNDIYSLLEKRIQKRNISWDIVKNEHHRGILILFDNGEKVPKIASEYHLSRQRVWQIINKYIKNDI